MSVTLERFGTLHYNYTKIKSTLQVHYNNTLATPKACKNFTQRHQTTTQLLNCESNCESSCESSRESSCMSNFDSNGGSDGTMNQKIYESISICIKLFVFAVGLTSFWACFHLNGWEISDQAKICSHAD